LEEIRTYLSQYYESTATNFFRLLKKEIQLLKEDPNICKIYDDDPDYRTQTVGSYLVFYSINEDDKIVEIHRILHYSRDIRRQLSGEPGHVKKTPEQITSVEQE
jgi:plasmid stabilization system protein ParE